MAALTDRATSPFALRACSVLALRAALANAAKLIQPLPDIRDLKSVESLLPEVRNNMYAAEYLARLVCFRCEIRPDYFLQPVEQECLNRRHV